MSKLANDDMCPCPTTGAGAVHGGDAGSEGEPSLSPRDSIQIYTKFRTTSPTFNNILPPNAYLSPQQVQQLEDENAALKEQLAAALGLGRIFALYHRSSTSYHIR